LETISLVFGIGNCDRLLHINIAVEHGGEVVDALPNFEKFVCIETPRQDLNVPDDPS